MNKINEYELSMFEIFMIINKNRKNIIIITIITTLLATVYSFIPGLGFKNNYEAISSISIVYNYRAPEIPEQITEGYVYYQDRMNGTVIPTIQGYAQSLSLLREIIDELNITDKNGNLIKVNKLKNNILLQREENSNLLLIKVKDKDGKLAAEIANKIPDKLIQMARENTDLQDYDINVIDYAIIDEAYEINKTLIVLLGCVLGLILSILYSLISNYLSIKIQHKSQIKSMNLEIELVYNEQINEVNQKKILYLAKLSEKKNILIGAESLNDSIISTETIELFKENDINITIMSYKSEDFILKIKQNDKTLIIVNENKSLVKDIYELSLLIKKYDLNVSIIYLESRK